MASVGGTEKKGADSPRFPLTCVDKIEHPFICVHVRAVILSRPGAGVRRDTFFLKNPNMGMCSFITLVHHTQSQLSLKAICH